jgi:hypothetical protein
MNTAYRVVATAYRTSLESADSTISVSDAASNTASFTTPALVVPSPAPNSTAAPSINDAPLAVALPVKLRNQTYNGHGSFKVVFAPSGKNPSSITNVDVTLSRPLEPSASPYRLTGLQPTNTASGAAPLGPYTLTNLWMGKTYRLTATATTSNKKVYSGQFEFTMPALNPAGQIEDDANVVTASPGATPGPMVVTVPYN